MNLGVDIGSRTIKAACVTNGRLVAHRIESGGIDPRVQALRLLAELGVGEIVATGYGRHLAQKHFAKEAITEIKAHALGARYFHPECATVIDVGGQDAKVILLDSAGRVEKFQMNDKCAAGTGRFMEVIAASLGYAVAEFADVAKSTANVAPINSMCAVFAESEVISLKNSGHPIEEIATAVHLSVVDRLASMVERLGYRPPVAFTGGMARNAFIVATLAERLGTKIATCTDPDIVGAVGAAIHGAKNAYSIA